MHSPTYANVRNALLGNLYPPEDIPHTKPTGALPELTGVLGYDPTPVTTQAYHKGVHNKADT